MNILSFDIESPDGQFNVGNICEFGYTLSNTNFDIIHQDNLLIKPIIPLVRLNRRVNFAYTAAQYNNAPTFDRVAPQIARVMSGDDTLVIGHAIHNDIICLKNAFKAHNLVMPSFKFIDTQVIFCIFKDEKAVIALDKIATFIGADFIHHRADQDAMLALKTLEYVCERLNCDIAGAMELYGIKCGTATMDEIVNCSTPYFAGCAPSVSSKNSKKKLLARFIDELASAEVKPKIEHAYSNKKINVDPELEFEDLNLTRRILQKLNDIGAKYMKYSTYCDIYVSNTLPNEEQLLNKTILLNDFLAKLGNLPEMTFDDEAILEEIKKERTQELYKRSWSC